MYANKICIQPAKVTNTAATHISNLWQNAKKSKINEQSEQINEKQWGTKAAIFQPKEIEITKENFNCKKTYKKMLIGIPLESIFIVAMFVPILKCLLLLDG